MIWLAAIWSVSFVMIYVEAWRVLLPLRKDLELSRLTFLRWATVGPVLNGISVFLFFAGTLVAPLILIYQVTTKNHDVICGMFAAAVVLEGLEYSAATQRAEARGIDRMQLDVAIDLYEKMTQPPTQ